MPVAIETNRLLLRPLQLEDAEQTQVLFPHWEIVKQLNTSVPWPYPPDGAFTYYRDVALPAIERGEEWHWTLRLKQSPEHHIGVICLTRNDEDNRSFWMGLPWQNQGLMHEAVVAVTEYWFDALGSQALRTKKAASNIPSREISKRTGMRLVRTHDHDFFGGREPADVWEITAPEWSLWKSQRS